MTSRLKLFLLAIFWLPTTATWYSEYRRTIDPAKRTNMVTFYLVAGGILNAASGGQKLTLQVDETNTGITETLVGFIASKVPKKT